jgi:molecular chaperone GrpE
VSAPQDGDPRERPAAGPVAQEGTSSSQAAGDVPSSTPPAEEQSQTTPPGQTSPANDDSSEVERDLDSLVLAEQQRDEYLELAKRTKADFENYRKRMAAEVQAASARGKVELAAQLIGVIDNLERALQIAGIEPAAEQAPEEPLAQGILLTYRELCAVLERSGIEGFDPKGEKFDPAWHEALSTLPATDGVQSGTVVETMQKGYRFGEQLIRPARVVVSE